MSWDGSVTLVQIRRTQQVVARRFVAAASIEIMTGRTNLALRLLLALHPVEDTATLGSARIGQSIRAKHPKRSEREKDANLSAQYGKPSLSLSGAIG
jgi:hypothetical protein